MTELRSLLVHMDASPRSLQRLHLACALANSPAASGAQMTALYGVAPLAAQCPASGMVAGALAMMNDLDSQRRDAARQLFERVRGESGAGPVLSWAELRDEALVPGFVAQAVCADALVLGQHDPQGAKAAGVPPDFVPSVLLASGKPALVLPYAGDFTRVGENVLVAWKYSRESARAVASALPLLRGARQVHVTLSNGKDPQALMKPQGGLEIMGWLSAHGVRAQLHHRLVEDDAPGESLLSLACDVDADLLVMGCYGHSRAREWALGGASRTVLGSMTLPVWMAH